MKKIIFTLLLLIQGLAFAQGPFWNGKPILTEGDLAVALKSLTSYEEGQKLMSVLREFNIHADVNVYHFITFRDLQGGERIQRFTGVGPDLPLNQTQKPIDIAASIIFAHLENNMIHNSWTSHAHSELMSKSIYDGLIKLTTLISLDESVIIADMPETDRAELFYSLEKMILANKLLPSEQEILNLEEKVKALKGDASMTVEKLYRSIREPLESLRQVYAKINPWNTAFTEKDYVLLEYQIRNELLKGILEANHTFSLKDEDVVTLFEELGKGTGRFRKFFLQLKIQTSLVENTTSTGVHFRPYEIFVDGIRTALNHAAEAALTPVKPFELVSKTRNIRVREADVVAPEVRASKSVIGRLNLALQKAVIR